MAELKSFRYTAEIDFDTKTNGSELSSVLVSEESSHSSSLGKGKKESSLKKNEKQQEWSEEETLNGEYQMMQHQLSSQDETEEFEEKKSISKYEIGREIGSIKSLEVGSPNGSSVVVRKGLAMSPHAPAKDGRPRSRLRNLSEQSQPLDSPPQTPTMSHSFKNHKNGDSGSDQDSIKNSQSLYANHFEIRWRNVNLVTRKSKLARFISENAIYKHLKGNSEEQKEQVEKEQQNKIFYSSPLRHKLGLGGGIERYEMSSSNIGPVVAALDKQPPAADKWSIADQGLESADYRTILRNLSGSVFSGQLTAILGPSGVGKTSLLNSLTGRNTLDGTGNVTLLGGASKRMSVVTVPQADILPGKLTALEDLSFTSRLKNPKTGFNHKRNIARLVRHLQMEKFLNTRIDKLSGGEARRLSIARELLNSPDIMILDEPTSGLDANTCKKIISALHDIVEQSEQILDRPMSIIVTIHQPQQEVLNLFHRIYVMAQGGRAIYEGPPDQLMGHLISRSSLLKVCPSPEQLNENPAIVAIEVASGEYGGELIEELASDHESNCYDQYFADDGTPLLANGSPFLTPKTLRPPKKSPVSVSASRMSPLERRMLAKGPHQQQAKEEQLSLGRPTPKLEDRRHFMGNQVDRVSSMTNLSFCSTYDADLPQQISRLKVDKRLRRSVVMKGDFISHTWTLMSRCWLLTTRDTFLMAIRVIGFCMVACGMVQIFASSLDKEEHVCPLYESQVDDLLGYIRTAKTRLLNMQSLIKQSNNTHLFFFQLCLCICMVTSALTGLVFPLQMRMFIREYKNGWYSPATFITSQTLAELPVDMIGPIITVLLVYPLCNQPESVYYWREIAYIVVLVMASMICKSQAQIVGAFLMNSVENSVFLSCVMVCPAALLSGISVRISSLSVPLQYSSYASFLRYAFECLFVIRYGYGICPCDEQLVKGYPIQASSDLIPPQLDRMSKGLLDLYSQQPINPNATTTTTNPAPIGEPLLAASSQPNFIVEFLRLISSASNMFPSNMEQLGNCSSYTSLGLMSMNISDYILPRWITVLFLMLVFSRILTYYTVKSVIKLQST